MILIKSASKESYELQFSGLLLVLAMGGHVRPSLFASSHLRLLDMRGEESRERLEAFTAFLLSGTV